jgi:hypothetical protein
MDETTTFDLKATLTKYWWVVAAALYFLMTMGGTKARRRKTKMRARSTTRRARRTYRSARSKGGRMMRRMRRK